MTASSWVEGLSGRLRRAPVPRWVLFGGAILGWTGITSAIAWLDGSLAAPELDPMLLIGSILPVALAWSMLAQDDLAERSLRSLRPTLELDDQEVEVVARDLRRTPASWAAVALVGGLVAAVGSVLGSPESWGLAADGPTSAYATHLVTAALASVTVFGFLAHVISQLRIVDALHRRHVRVDLFRLEPLYAFATLTSRTGIALLVVASLGMAAVVLAVGSRFSLSIADVASAALLVAVAIACFVAPLLSLHDRIVAEKDRRSAEANAALAATLAELHRRIAAGEFDGAAALNDAVAAANASVQAVARISTWPWRQETLRAFLGAVLLPIGLWLTFELLGRLLPA